MGTNYYFTANPCATCGHGEKLHICKSLTMFQARVEWPDEDPYEHRLSLTSWAEWREFLRTTPGTIEDEYGATRTVEGFIASVEAVELEYRSKQFRWMAANTNRAADGPSLGKDWLDADGFSFTTSDFS